jgi:hypothetical protein
MRKGFLSNSTFLFEKGSSANWSTEETGRILPRVLSHCGPRRAQTQQYHSRSNGNLLEGPQGNLSARNLGSITVANEQEWRVTINWRVLRYRRHVRLKDDWSIQKKEQIRRTNVGVLFQIYPKVNLSRSSFQFESFDSRIILLKDFIVKYIGKDKEEQCHLVITVDNYLHLTFSPQKIFSKPDITVKISVKTL